MAAWNIDSSQTRAVDDLTFRPDVSDHDFHGSARKLSPYMGHSGKLYFNEVSDEVEQSYVENSDAQR